MSSLRGRASLSSTVRWFFRFRADHPADAELVSARCSLSSRRTCRRSGRELDHRRFVAPADFKLVELVTDACRAQARCSPIGLIPSTMCVIRLRARSRHELIDRGEILIIDDSWLLPNSSWSSSSSMRVEFRLDTRNHHGHASCPGRQHRYSSRLAVTAEFKRVAPFSMRSSFRSGARSHPAARVVDPGEGHRKWDGSSMRAELRFGARSRSSSAALDAMPGSTGSSPVSDGWLFPRARSRHEARVVVRVVHQVIEPRGYCRIQAGRSLLDA